MSDHLDLKAFAVKLFNINAVKFGEFKTKLGFATPIYIDLRILISYPDITKTLANLLLEKMKGIDVDVLCGVPYTALPVATAISLQTSIPMVMRRQEQKCHGSQKLIEGVFHTGDRCVIVEDVVNSGSSILEMVKDLQDEGLKCKDAIIFLNREQGGANLLQNQGITMHALLTLSQLVEYLFEAKCIDEAMVQTVAHYINDNQVTRATMTKIPNRVKMSFLERASLAKNPVASKLFQIMATKQTTLCLAADLTDSTKILNLAEQVGPYICVLKTHIDIIEDFNENFLKPLKEIAQRHNFILFEDRKFADIGLVTVHSLFGKGVLDAIQGIESAKETGVFLLAETSASESLITDTYTKATLELASEFPDLVAGIVCQNQLFLDHPGMIQLTPGVKVGDKGDTLGQRYNSPEYVVVEKGADIAVVGRGITEAKDPVVAAKNYRDLLWQSYIKRMEC
ncbi:uridine 5'-monophosphate synthase-like isoform X2 [Euwallacea fornicatus]|uniref:uridine 5'-monophosphate synthase-like isoform X2 n=1 Tax=Euwallacea fornicatus TaxID=995702 RepID=UPI00338D9DD4